MAHSLMHALRAVDDSWRQPGAAIAASDAVVPEIACAITASLWAIEQVDLQDR